MSANSFMILDAKGRYIDKYKKSKKPRKFRIHILDRFIKSREEVTLVDVHTPLDIKD